MKKVMYVADIILIYKFISCGRHCFIVQIQKVEHKWEQAQVTKHKLQNTFINTKYRKQSTRYKIMINQKDVDKD